MLQKYDSDLKPRGIAKISSSGYKSPGREKPQRLSIVFIPWSQLYSTVFIEK